MRLLPYQVPDEAARELERCYKDLGVKATQLFSNVNGEPLFLDKFDPLFAMANELGAALPDAPHRPVDGGAS